VERPRPSAKRSGTCSTGTEAQEEAGAGAGSRGRAEGDKRVLGAGRILRIRGRALILRVGLGWKRRSGDGREMASTHAAREENQERE